MTSIANGESGFSVRTKLNNILSLETSVQTSTSYSIVPSDEGKLVTLNNASAITVTVPSGLGTGFYCMMMQLGAGTVTVVADSDVDLVSFGDRFEAAGQYAVITLYSYGEDIFVLGGATN